MAHLIRININRWIKKDFSLANYSIINSHVVLISKKNCLSGIVHLFYRKNNAKSSNIQYVEFRLKLKSK